jgi:hypothetical protein
MSKTKNSVLAGIALAGLLAGTTARAAAMLQSGDADAGKKSEKSKKEIEKHACKGMNSCKGQGGGSKKERGKNSCKGKGACATDGSKPPMDDKKKDEKKG